MPGPSLYPNIIDGYTQLPVAVDGVTPINASSVNNLRSAIINIENALGSEPAGSYSAVSERLIDIEEEINNILNIISYAISGLAGGDLSGEYSNLKVIKIQGREVLDLTPNSGDALVWNNAESRWEPGGVAATGDYQLLNEKGQPNGYSSLNSSGVIPTNELGTGVADNTTFLRGDNTWATPPGTGGGGGGGQSWFGSW